jgi:hypothetical protein
MRVMIEDMIAIPLKLPKYKTFLPRRKITLTTASDLPVKLNRQRRS